MFWIFSPLSSAKDIRERGYQAGMFGPRGKTGWFLGIFWDFSGYFGVLVRKINTWLFAPSIWGHKRTTKGPPGDHSSSTTIHSLYSNLWQKLVVSWKSFALTALLWVWFQTRDDWLGGSPVSGRRSQNTSVFLSFRLFAYLSIRLFIYSSFCLDITLLKCLNLKY